MPGRPVALRRAEQVLPRLVAVGLDEFAADYWGRRALLSRADELPGDGFADLLSADDIDELVSDSRAADARSCGSPRRGRPWPTRRSPRPAGSAPRIADQVSDDRLTRLFADGSTIVLQALHRSWPPVLEFCQELAAELGHPVQANAYITPPQNQGFSDHYDVHDVFVLQLVGEKRWLIHEPVLESPLRDQPWTDRRAAVERRAAERPVIETVLRPGDCLYLPRGFLHAAQALGGITTHLTIGVHVWTAYALAERWCSRHSTVAGTGERPWLPATGRRVHRHRDRGRHLSAVRDALIAAIRTMPTPTP